MKKKFVLTSGQLAELVKSDGRLYELEKRFNSGDVTRFRSLRIILPFLYKMEGTRYTYAKDAVEYIVLALEIARHSFASHENIGTIFEMLIPSQFKDIYKLYLFYHEEPDYTQFLRRLINKGIKLPEHIVVNAAPDN